MARLSLVVIVALVGVMALVQGRPQAPTAKAIAPGGSPLDALRDDITLLNVSDAELAEFLSVEEAVVEFAKCIQVGVKNCRSSVGSTRLLRQIKSLGIGGRCKQCNPKQQARVEDVVFNVISTFSQKYPAVFQQTLPHITNLI